MAPPCDGEDDITAADGLRRRQSARAGILVGRFRFRKSRQDVHDPSMDEGREALTPRLVYVLDHPIMNGCDMVGYPILRSWVL
jgi:hypothetical protein